MTRLALRGWDAELVDPDDIAEQENTHYTLKEGAVSLVLGTLGALIHRPRPFLAALRTALSLSRRSLVLGPTT